MTQDRVLTSQRVPRWLVGLMLVGAAFSGVACEASVDTDSGEVEENEENGDNGDNGSDVDADVDLDTDVQEDTDAEAEEGE